MPYKYQREIEEILQQAGDLGEEEATPNRQERSFAGLVWEYVKGSLGGGVFSLSPGRIMLGAVMILLAALVLNLTSPGYGIVGLLAWAGLILFIVGYALFFIKPRSVRKDWRGESVEYTEPRWHRSRDRFLSSLFSSVSRGGKKRWRDQPVNYDGGSLWSKLRRRFR